MQEKFQPAHWDMLSDKLLKDCSQTVLPEWIDYNGHMNVAYYVLAFDRQTDLFFDALGLDEAYRERHQVSIFAGESHVMYLNEVGQGDRLHIATQLFGVSDRKLHFFHWMYDGESGGIVATNELVGFHMDMANRRPAPFGPVLAANLETWRDAHVDLPRSRWAGRSMSLS